MVKPLVSIIVPVYNNEKWLRYSLKSIINQSYQDLEIILIDDGSNDNSASICDAYEKKDKRIKVVHKINEGVSVARNIGIKLATGTYIQFVDSDDVISSCMTEKLVNIMIDQNVDIVMCGFVEISEEKIDDLVFFSKEKNICGVMNRSEALKNIISNDGFRGFPVNKLFRRDVIESNTKIRFNPDISMCEDLLFCVEYLTNVNKVAYTNERLYGYIKHKNSLSHKVDERTLSVLDAKKKIAELYDKNGLSEGKSWYAYSVAYMFTFINSEIIKKRKKDLSNELRKKKNWFRPELHTKREQIIFKLISIQPVLAGYLVILLKKVRKELRYENKRK